jgi:hypothetical protein
MMSSTSKSGRGLRTLVTALGLAAVIGGTGIAPALAHDGYGDRGDRRWEQERREHAWRAHEAHEWRERHQRYYRQPAPAYYPGYYYAPPPPVVYAPPPALRFVFPLNFR